MIRVLPNVSIRNRPVCFFQRDTRTEGDRSLLPYMTLQPYDIELVRFSCDERSGGERSSIRQCALDNRGRTELIQPIISFIN